MPGNFFVNFAKAMEGKQYIQVVVPLKLDWTPVYSASAGVVTGQRVLVRVARKQYVAVVCRTGVVPDIDESRIIPVDSEECGLPPITPAELELWNFIADYYLCTAGEVYKAAYPSMKLKSEQVAADAATRHEHTLAAMRERRKHALEKRILRLEASLARREKALVGKHAESVMERLMDERDRISEELRAAREALARLENEAVETPPPGVPSTAPAGRAPAGKPLLLWGGDRVRRYARMARETLDAGLDVLLLVPDIIFSDRIEAELAPDFDELRVCNSKQSQVRRRKLSDDLRGCDGPFFVLGTRSAVFLPFRRLGLIIVDEEQDTMFKQTEPAPRYNGRDVAVKLGAIHGAQVVLGSALPSLESVLNSRSGKYDSAITPAASAAVSVIDVRAEARKNGMVESFSRRMADIVAGTDGPVTVVRMWEKEDEVSRLADTCLPGRDVRIMTMAEARKSGFSPVTVILQADALVGRDDFRADERAAQIVAQLSALTRTLVIQTAVPARWDGSRNVDDLLAERREFGFPPFTRLVSLEPAGGQPQRIFLKRDGGLASRKAEILAGTPRGVIIDVDPV